MLEATEHDTSASAGELDAARALQRRALAPAGRG
jgi:hypothetical protein